MKNSENSQHFETKIVNEREVCCDGGKGPLGHPAIYLNISDNNEIVCPYCSCKFIYQDAAE